MFLKLQSPKDAGTFTGELYKAYNYKPSVPCLQYQYQCRGENRNDGNCYFFCTCKYLTHSGRNIWRIQVILTSLTQEMFDSYIIQLPFSFHLFFHCPIVVLLAVVGQSQTFLKICFKNECRMSVIFASLASRSLLLHTLVSARCQNKKWFE